MYNECKIWLCLLILVRAGSLSTLIQILFNWISNMLFLDATKVVK